MTIRFYDADDHYGFLSNFFSSPLDLDGESWPTVEHYFQAMKFPGDPELQARIRDAESPGEAKRVAHASDGWRSDWDTYRDSVMRRAVRAKFEQHPDLAAQLLATGQTPLVERATQDAYWGEGLDGRGLNRLGGMLEEVRTSLSVNARPSVNRKILDWLWSEGRIAIRRSPLFDQAPASHESPVQWERVEGMLLGLAIGDALGNTTEGRAPASRQELRGEIRDYLPNRHANSRPVGLPSDDSQLAFWTLEQFNRDGALIPDHLARRFVQQRIFGIGKAVSDFRTRFVEDGLPWWEARVASAGNGALMRLAPILVPSLNCPTAELWTDSALAAMVTHNDTASIASSVGFVAMLWDLLGMSKPPRPEWWLERYLSVVRPLETETLYASRSPHFRQLGERPFSEWIDELVTEAVEQERTVLDACERWYSGAYLLETVPSALHILMRYAGDPEEAIVRAVNDTWDNDTVAAIVGVAVGALYGTNALPARWRDSLLGRLGESDYGALFPLLDDTRKICHDRDAA